MPATDNSWVTKALVSEPAGNLLPLIQDGTVSAAEATPTATLPSCSCGTDPFTQPHWGDRPAGWTVQRGLA
jgi:hypothetical protein